MKKNAFLARVVEFFFVKFFQDVAYGLGLMMEDILLWQMGSEEGIPSPYDGLEGRQSRSQKVGSVPASPYLTNSPGHSQHHLLH